MNNNDQQRPLVDLPPFVRSKKVIVIAIFVAVAVFIGALSVLSPVFLIGPIQANDEEKAISALFLTLAIALVASAVLTAVSVILFRKKEAADYHNKVRAIVRQRIAEEDEEKRRAAAAAKQKAAEEEYARKEKEQREARTVCEFCGGPLRMSDRKGISYNSSYTKDVTASVTYDGKLNLTANKVGYGVTQGEEHYTCSKCGYSVIAHYEILSGSWGESKSYKRVNIDASPIEFYMQIRGGRLSKSFPVK